MQKLLKDIIHYTPLVQSTEEGRIVGLENVIDDVRGEFKDVIEIKKAILKVDKLQIVGYNTSSIYFFQISLVTP